MERDIMTISQVAEYLQLNEMTVYKLANERRIPAFKIGSHWRMKKTDLHDCIEKLKNGETI
ncbi:helix-turn-helix domain-containing protein [Halobacillus seohaensis]|uniref:Helix-turn-helix domain-containing protein n=1 Tax=Halobacillus seohaensis TaxID=447421 RepID=A0ABW2EQT1_9BACI